MKIKTEDLTGEYREIYEELIMPVDTKIKLTDVILSDENIKKLNEFINETQYRDRLYEFGLEPMNRIIMFGASGTGKTYLSKALANHLNYTMLYIDIAKALSEGSVAVNISRIFKLANYLGNCIIMFDECDSIAWNRDGSTPDGGVIRRATNSIFQQLDQMNHTNIFISATNLLHRVDVAFERRFNMKMEFLKPKMEIKDSIKHFMNMKPKFVLIDDVDDTVKEIIQRRAMQYAKLSYYEIEELVYRNMKKAVLANTDEVKTSDIFEDLAIAMGVSIQYDKILKHE